MTEKDFRKLNRAELLKMLLEQSREIERLKAALQEAEEKITERDLSVEQAGSIAEAALRINGVFEDAQKAADQYLENIHRQNDEIQEKCQRMEAYTKSKCDQMVIEAEKRSDEYWQTVKGRIEQLIDQQEGLREVLLYGLTREKNG